MMAIIGVSAHNYGFYHQPYRNHFLSVFLYYAKTNLINYFDKLEKRERS